jgi:CHAT domain-containing protein
VPTSSDTVIDDGIITALEVADLDLRRAELVMLSACESGSRSNDRREGVGVGVLSMQRAFEMAGAKRCIAALWPVHDQSTQELMREFYGRYWSEGVSAVEALTQAQRTLIRKYHYNVGQQVITRGPAGKRRVVRRRQDSLHPFFWGAFVLSGDWRPDS